MGDLFFRLNQPVQSDFSIFGLNYIMVGLSFVHVSHIYEFMSNSSITL